MLAVLALRFFTDATAQGPNLAIAIWERQTFTETLHETTAAPLPTANEVNKHLVPIYVFGASAGNTTNATEWDVIKVYVSINTMYYNKSKPNIFCCIEYKPKQKTFIIRKAARNIWVHPVNVTQRTYFLDCPNVRHLKKDIARRVGITVSNSTCKENISLTSIFLPYKEQGVKIAIGTQVAFGNIDPELIIEWLEAHLYLGVDKVISYYYRTLNSKALSVLRYYHNLGVLDLYRFDPPVEGNSSFNSDY